jgi:feruloyl esterase
LTDSDFVDIRSSITIRWQQSKRRERLSLRFGHGRRGAKLLGEKTVKTNRSAAAPSIAIAIIALAIAVFAGNSRATTPPACSVTYFQSVAPANVTITSASMTTTAPIFCDIRGTIATTTDNETNSVLFALGLPELWNGRFVFIGNGGFAGSLQGVLGGEYAAAIGAGFAAAATDTGHESPYGPALGSLDGSFGLINGQAGDPNLPAIEDFAYRAVHLSAVTAETLTTSYYQSSMFSYFDGCSTGGRQALVEAQKFPMDFNGIIAGDPAIGNPIAGFNWNDQALLQSPDGYLDPTAIATLDAAVTQQCDGSDGLIDGMIEDPRLCHFDPKSIECKKGATTGCLTAAQVKTVKAILHGAQGVGGQLYPGYTPSNPGGADGWTAWITGTTTPTFDSANPWGTVPTSFLTAPYQFSFQDQFMKYFAFQDPNYDSLSFDFHKIGDIRTLDKIVREYGSDGENPDLRPFFKAGGKLLMYHGWADPALTPFVSVDYYEAARKALHGDFNKLRKNARLFMVPGMHHCTGGPGPYDFDPLTPLIEWVEGDQAPKSIIGENPGTGRTFPLCAYPQIAVYTGSGSVDDAKNWVCRDHLKSSNNNGR